VTTPYHPYCPPFVPMAEHVVPATSGDVTLDTFEVTKEEAAFENMRSIMGGAGRLTRIEPGAHARLARGNTLWMSDTAGERASNYALLMAARGDVLINGLGIGMLPAALARKADVRSVTVVEIDPDVIAALTPTLERVAPATRVIQGDAFLPERTGLARAKDGGGFDAILSDIWPTICSDDYVQHVAVRRAWRAWLRPGGEHRMWHEAYVRREWRKDRAGNDDPWRGVYRFDMEREPSAAQQATALLTERRAEAKS